MSKPSFGISFSLKQCRNFDLDWQPVLHSLIHDLGVKQFRLMSYWDEHETTRGNYDFATLAKQLKIIQAAGGEVSLCLGVRQPRWPENHWPNWAWRLPKPERDTALMRYLDATVAFAKEWPCITSYQLENEALLTNFGTRPDTDRRRLRAEFKLVKHLDPTRAVAMSTSTSWGIPIRRPIPDYVGFSYYQVLYHDGKYRLSFHRPWLDRIRAALIRLIHRKQSFIHELQAEPWGPKNIWEMDLPEQYKSMSLAQLQSNIRQAEATGLYPIYLWGAEWWYWLKSKNRAPEHWNAVQKLYRDTTADRL